MRLSMLRARACASFIADSGIDITRIVAYGYGESQPLVSNDTPDGRRTNRRVEFELKF
jgi:outer membrane protein OmpA-like peptidoglycan-associated protein